MPFKVVNSNGTGKMKKYLWAAALLLVATQAEARPRAYAVHPECNVTMPCAGVTTSARGERIAKEMGFGVAVKHYTSRSYENVDQNYKMRVRGIKRQRQSQPTSIAGGVVQAAKGVTEMATRMLPHPSGCPRSAFCGCGAAQEVGKGGDRSLWLASNWYKFPRTAPAPGTVGVRSHHVFVLKQHINGNNWLVADYNSGGRLSRLHVRSISGYTIVQPS